MMSIEDIRQYCLSKEGVTEEMPFGPHNVVFKVAGKMFLLLSLRGDPLFVNVKCNPEKALALREQYDCVQPGYHMNKKHWNSIYLEPGLPEEKLQSWIDDSYTLVRKK